ncbi:flagellar filament capping protein FliD [Paenibacillus sp. FJAT-26967]|uniref:flagellar filament capping protein FliD n=1 Tax=Paenibacillus sp. FJAT-26967 TaxID=1729690 RepID=UPI00083942F9|nr:flagellar filament capping protein FliD [Paenibacillus sp. FJAT-26967]
MAGISGPTRLTGFSGQLDTDSLVKKLMDTERVPLNTLQKKKQLTLWQREDYRSMNTSLLTLRKAMNELRFENKFETVKSTSSNTAVLDVVSSGVNPGVSSVKITQLANSASVISEKVNKLPTEKLNINGSFTIEGADPAKSVEITITADSTIDSVLKDINGASAKTGVKANFDRASGVLYLNSITTGAGSKVKVTDANGTFANIFGANTTLTSEGKDAAYSVNGTNITATSNSVNINGVQVTLRSLGEASIGAVVDRSAAVDKIKDFVKQYNELVDKFSEATTTKKNRGYQPLTTEEKEAMTESQITLWEKKARQGDLYNDNLLKDTLSSMRSALNMPLEGITNPPDPKSQLRMLSQIGVNVMNDFRENGKLEIDEKKLEEAINTRFDEVKLLFTKSSDTPNDTPENMKKRKSELGFADRLYETISAQLTKFTKKIGSGSIEALDESVLGKQLKDYNTRETDLERKLVDIENRYYKKFTAMEKALQKLNSQGSWISSQLGG